MENKVANYNCVTLQGDSYRADGVLSGGAQQQQPILPKIARYIETATQLKQASNNLEKLSSEIEVLRE